MGVAVRWGSWTDTGRLRELNEDSVLVTDTLWAVADGMGGHAAGEVASLIAVEALRANATPTVNGIVDAIRHANRSILEAAAADPAKYGMGTTMSALALVTGDDGEELVVANVGDSRVYRLRQGELEQVSEDHSLVEDLVREGRISPAEARVHPNRNIVTRALGNEREVGVDWWVVDPVEGDRYLLCSDGLTDEVEDHEIAHVLRTQRDPDDCARRLVDIANAAGGRDNITCVVVDVVDDGGRSEAASAALAMERSSGAPQPLVRESSGEGRTNAHKSGDVTDAAPAPRRVTWRVIVFVAAIVAVFAAAFGGTAWFARNTYYVGVDDRGCVTIYKGRPGGLLWFDPTIVECTGVQLDEIQPARRDEVSDGHDASSVSDAQRYVDNITTTPPTEPPRTPTRPSAPTTTATTTPP